MLQLSNMAIIKASRVASLSTRFWLRVTSHAGIDNFNFERASTRERISKESGGISRERPHRRNSLKMSWQPRRGSSTFSERYALASSKTS